MIAAPGPLVALLAHLRATDPERFLVAVRPGADGAERVVAFASASRREHVWFLAMLFVLPDEQARGLGRALLEAVLPAGGDPALAGDRAPTPPSRSPTPSTPATGSCPGCRSWSSSGGPTGASARRPCRTASAPSPSSSSRPARPTGPGRAGSPRRSTTLDRAVLGYAHPPGPRLPAGDRPAGPPLRGGGRTGRRLRVRRDRPDGSDRWPSRTSRWSPACWATSSAPSSRAGVFSAWVPGAAGAAVSTLLGAGLRLEDFPVLLCWDRPFADFARYLPITLALL